MVVSVSAEKSLKVKPGSDYRDAPKHRHLKNPISLKSARWICQLTALEPATNPGNTNRQKASSRLLKNTAGAFVQS
jgi:hypothetical protein